MIVQTGLDYDVRRDEVEAQIERLGDDQFSTFANEALVELEERYGMTTPVSDNIQELTNRYYRGLELLQTREEPMIFNELAVELGQEINEFRDRVACLIEFGRVRFENDTVNSVV